MLWSAILVIVCLGLLLPLTAIVLDSPLGDALASHLERGRPRSGGDELVRRLRTLESEVDRLSTEVSRLEEESDFMRELLAGRPDGPGSERSRLPGGGEEETGSASE